MNEVLAAVGVCEKKNEEDRLARGKTFSPQEWRLIQDAENDHAELVHIVAARTRHICTWWIVSLRKRIQVRCTQSDQTPSADTMSRGGLHS